LLDLCQDICTLLTCITKKRTRMLHLVFRCPGGRGIRASARIEMENGPGRHRGAFQRRR
jgi:hypothetical protein